MREARILGAVGDADRRQVEHEVGAVDRPWRRRRRSRMSPSTTVDRPASHRARRGCRIRPRVRLSSTTMSPYVPCSLAVDEQVDDVRADQAGAAGDDDLVEVVMVCSLTVVVDVSRRAHSRDGRRSTLLLLLRRCISGIHRQREHLVGGRLGVREVAVAVAELGERLLQVHRDRVVDAGADALLGEVRLERGAIAVADRVHVVDVAAIGGCDGRDDAESGEQLVVALRPRRGAPRSTPRCRPSSPPAPRPGRLRGGS